MSNSKDHNLRVRATASTLPPGLAKSYKAIAYRADFSTSTETGCTVSGFRMDKISALSFRNGYGRSESTLWRDVRKLEHLGYLVSQPGKRTRVGSKIRQEPTTFLVAFKAEVKSFDPMAQAKKRPTRAQLIKRLEKFPGITRKTPASKILELSNGHDKDCLCAPCCFNFGWPDAEVYSPTGRAVIT